MIKIDYEQYQQTKRKLNQAWCAKREMDKYNELISKAVSAVQRITPSYSLTPGSNNCDSDKMANFAAEVDDLYTRAEEATKNYLKAVKDVDDLINTLENKLYISVLRRRYLGCERWEDIASELGYSERHIQRLHVEAIEALAGNND